MRDVGVLHFSCTVQLLFSAEETRLLYPCHSLVVDLEVSSGRQRFFVGHTDKVAL